MGLFWCLLSQLKMSWVPLLMDSFWFTESPLRLGLDSCFSSCPTLPWVHPLSTSVSNDYFLRKSYNQCFIPLIIDLPTTNVKTFFFRCVLLASVVIWLFGGSSVQQPWLSYQHQPSIILCPFLFHSHLIELSYLTTLICQIKGEVRAFIIFSRHVSFCSN